jgi:hypothetical protein
VVSFTPRPIYPRGKSPPLVPTGLEAGWAPEPVWTRWTGQNSCPYRDSNYDSSAIQPVASCYTDCAILGPKQYTVCDICVFVLWGVSQKCNYCLKWDIGLHVLYVDTCQWLLSCQREGHVETSHNELQQ